VGGLFVVGGTKLVVVCASSRPVASLILAAVGCWLGVDAAKYGCAKRQCNDNRSTAVLLQKVNFCAIRSPTSDIYAGARVSNAKGDVIYFKPTSSLEL
jgi:hypothetical protein